MEKDVFKSIKCADFPVGHRKTVRLMKEAKVWVRYKKKIEA